MVASFSGCISYCSNSADCQFVFYNSGNARCYGYKNQMNLGQNLIANFYDGSKTFYKYTQGKSFTTFISPHIFNDKLKAVSANANT